MKILFDSENGSAKITSFRRSTILNYPCASVDYCAPYKVIFPKGAYRIELWGASARDSRGGYTRGEIYFKKEETFYIHIGAANGLYNSAPPFADTRGGRKGGGATDIRYSENIFYDFDSLKTRIMVAAGSGTWDYPSGSGMNAGGLVGENGVGNGRIGQGANQTSGGEIDNGVIIKGTFGLAGYTNSTDDWGATGGGGYYGGTSINNAGASGGGSSFISGYEGCDAIYENSTKDAIYHTHQPIHYLRFVFFHSIMKSGKESLPTPTVGTSIGHSGHGVAKITPLFILDRYITCLNKRRTVISHVLFIISLVVYK